MNVLVINHYSCNKGDRAVLTFIVRELVRNEVNSINISCHDPSLWPDAKQKLGESVKLVKWGWKTDSPGNNENLFSRIRKRIQRFYYPIIRLMLIKSLPLYLKKMLVEKTFLASLEKADLVISTGGHHVTTILARDAISGQLYDMALSILMDRKLILWSQSIGPLDFVSKRNEVFVTELLRRTDGIYVRDSQSIQELKELGVDGGKVHETYESVIGLSDYFDEYILPAKRDKIFGVAIYGAKQRSELEHNAYVKHITAVIDYAIDSGFIVRMFPMELKHSGSDDRYVINDIVKAVKQPIKCEVIDNDLDTISHLKEIAKCQIFMGHKTHSVIFALTVGTPLIALAYHVKTNDFMKQYGLEEYCVADSDITRERLIAKFKILLSNLDALGKSEYQKSAEFGRRVRNDFANLLNEGH